MKNEIFVIFYNIYPVSILNLCWLLFKTYLNSCGNPRAHIRIHNRNRTRSRTHIYSLAANYNVFRINKQQTWSLHAFCYTSLCLSVSCRVVCVCCMCPSTSSSSSLPLCIMTTCNLAFLFAAACIFLGRLVLPRRLGLLGLIANYG